MGSVFVHQLHEHITSLRGGIGLLLVLSFFIVNGLIASWRGDQLELVDARLQADVERIYDEVATVGQATGQTYRLVNSATGTEFIAEGGFDWFLGQVWLSPRSGAFSRSQAGRDTNGWMTRFENTDWILIVRLVLSFLCIVLAYDSIAGEKERGTLRQIMANPVSRIQVLAGKYLAHVAVLFAALTMGSLLSLLIISLSGRLELNGPLLASVGLFLLASVIYVSLFVLLALGVSALADGATSALVVLTMLWAAFIIIIPQSSYAIALQAVEVSREMEWKPRQAIWEAHDSLKQQGIQMRELEVARGDDFASEKRYARRINEAEEDQQRFSDEYIGHQLRRFSVARAVNMFSPGFAFQYAVESLLGTGVVKRQSFLAQARDYRTTLRDFLRTRDATDRNSPHILFFPGYMSGEPLNGREIPRFGERPVPLSESLALGYLPLLILLLETLAAFLFAFWAVNRTDLTGYAMAE